MHHNVHTVAGAVEACRYSKIALDQLAAGAGRGRQVGDGAAARQQAQGGRALLGQRADEVAPEEASGTGDQDAPAVERMGWHRV